MAEHINKTDTLNEGRVKLNAAISDAETAKVTAEGADVKSSQALANSESTQIQLDTIVIEGDSSVEAAQARVDEKGEGHATLKARIDDGFEKTSSQLAQNKLHVSYFGAVGDGITDDTQALQNALDSEYDVFSNVGENYRITDTIRQTVKKNVDFKGKIIYDGTKNKDAVVVGRHFNGVSTLSFHGYYFYFDVTTVNPNRIEESLEGFDLVKMINVRHCDIHVSANGGYRGFSLVGDRTGAYSNNIYLGSITDGVYRVVLDSLDGGYVNGNIFYKGSMASSNQSTNPTATTDFLITSSDGLGLVNSNNLFIKPSFNGKGSQPIHVDNGFMNKFTEIRAENGTHLKDYVYSTKFNDYTSVEAGYSIEDGKDVEFSWTGRSVISSFREDYTKYPFIPLYEWNYSPDKFFAYRTTPSNQGSSFLTRVKGLDTIFASTDSPTNIIDYQSSGGISFQNGVVLPLSPAGRVGVWVDVRDCKYLYVRIESDDFYSLNDGAMQPIFKAFDSNGNIITSNNDVEGIIGNVNYSSQTLEFDPNLRNRAFGVKLSDNVKTMFVGVRSNRPNGGSLKSFRLYGTESAHVWTTQKFGLDLPYNDIEGKLPIGTYIPNYDLTEETDSNGTYITKGYIIRTVNSETNRVSIYRDKLYI